MNKNNVDAWIATLPPADQEQARRCFAAMWSDGFYAGAARLPNRNPFDPALAAHSEPPKKRR